MKYITKQAYAKINIGLDVLRRLENGYHEVQMIMHSVKLSDELNFEKNGSGKATMTSTDKTIPEDGRNLIIKAANLFMETYQIKDGVHIELNKRIPHAAGLGGGSADAAVTFLALNEIFEVDASLEELQKLGVKIGADVPYCMMGGTALAEGIGEKLSKLPDLPECTVLLVKPKIAVSTPHVYQTLDATNIQNHPDMQGMLDALERQDLKGICKKLGNVLELVTVAEYPKLQEYKEKMMEYGALGSLMSGSGPTVFGIYETKEEAEIAAKYFKEQTEIANVEIA